MTTESDFPTLPQFHDANLLEANAALGSISRLIDAYEGILTDVAYYKDRVKRLEAEMEKLIGENAVLKAEVEALEKGSEDKKYGELDE